MVLQASTVHVTVHFPEVTKIIFYYFMAYLTYYSLFSFYFFPLICILLKRDVADPLVLFKYFANQWTLYSVTNFSTEHFLANFQPDYLPAFFTVYF
jgi:hypothetical protein